MAKRQGNEVGNLESMFLRLEELVLANSGEDEFEEIFKLVIAKLCDERFHEKRLLRPAAENVTFANVSTLLRDAERRWPGILASGAEPRLRPEHLQVCVTALAKHVISESSLEVIDAFFEFLVARASKGAKGQYFTPRHVVEMCVRMLKPRHDETVLDPACGSGGFLMHAFSFVKERSSTEQVKQFSSSKLFGFDFDGRAVRIAKSLLILAGDGSSNVLRLNSLLKPHAEGLFSTAAGGDDGSILTVEDVTKSRLRRHKGFDVILTNPPFAGEVRERNVLDTYHLGRGRVRIERDVLFLERCVELLRPGGRMAIVLPHNKFAMDVWAPARTWLMSKGRVLAVVGLGRHTFLPHTHQKASVLFFLKRSNEDAAQLGKAPILFAISERDGKDSTGRPVLLSGAPTLGPAWTRLDHDLNDVVTAFEEFFWRQQPGEAA